MYQIDYTNVGKRMKTLRKQAGYTQEQIADALDVTVAFISNIENDRVKMNLRVPVSYTHLRAHETDSYLVCRLLLEKKRKRLGKLQKNR